MVSLSATSTGRTLLPRNIIFLFLVFFSVRGWVILDWNNAAALSTMIPILICFSQSFQTGTATVHWTTLHLSPFRHFSLKTYWITGAEKPLLRGWQSHNCFVKPKFHYHAQKSLSLYCILNHMNPVYACNSSYSSLCRMRRYICTWNSVRGQPGSQFKMMSHSKLDNFCVS
jgi:hypothetical protein